jgi:isochorismate synthase
VLACTIAWDTAWKGADQLQGVQTIGFCEKDEAVEDTIAQLRALRPASLAHAASVCLQSPCTTYHHAPNECEWQDLLDTVQKKFKNTIDGHEYVGTDEMSVSPMVALDEYLRNGQKGLDELLAASKPADAIGGDSSSLVDGEQLIKLVLARKTDLLVEENVDCCDLLGAVQEKDPKAYQFMLRLPTGQCFLGCTPERLYARTGSNVVSEAVAGTRGRGGGGDVEEDFWLAFDLLQSQKDGLEFQLVRESILSIFGSLCSSVNLEVEKSVLKQGMVQHLYSRIAGILRPDVSDLDLITELHPTPAVCGQPDDGALCVLREFEMFDRGFYAGPFGWFGGDSADIAVAIRSSLIGPPAQKKTPITLFAGVGIVPGSLTQSEWKELDLKIRQFTSLFQIASNGLIKASSNCNVLVAQSMIDELCRLGHNTFCIAPGRHIMH